MGYWEKIKSALGKVSKIIWIIIAAVLLVLVIGVVVFLNTRPYAALIAGATNEEAATVMNWLESQGVTNYRMEGTGTILVPEAQAATLKAKLLQEQYSNANSSYSGYFERISALSTVRDRDAAWLVTLIEVMQETIRAFDGVWDASITIQPGEDNGYILDTNNVVNATAGVIVTMESGKTLTNEQVTAIRNYISHSVPNLAVENVSVSDSKGTPYDSFDIAGTSAADSTALKLQAEEYLANQITKRLKDVLEPTYGKDHVAISVNCTVELGDKTINDYEVRLPEFAQDGSTNGAGIIGNRYYSYELVNGDEATAGGVVGTNTNSQIPDYVESGEPQGQLQNILKGEGGTEFDNSKTQTYMVIHCATLTDVYVGVSVDSTPQSGPIDTADLRQFVASTVGIVPDIDMTELTTEQYQLQKAEYLSQKVGILNGPWYQAPETPPEPTWLDNLQALGIPPWAVFAAIGGLLLFAIILVTVILLVRRGRKKKQAEEQKAVEELLKTTMVSPDGEPIIGPDGEPIPIPVDENGDPIKGADVMDLHTERSMELRQSIREFVDENMEVAALLIKSWMKEDGDHG